MYNLTNLRDKDILNRIMVDFMNKFNNLMIVDSFKGNNQMPNEERSFFKDVINYNYWLNLKKEKSLNTVCNYKRRFNEIVETYSLNNVKNYLKQEMEKKFLFLMNSSCF